MGAAIGTTVLVVGHEAKVRNRLETTLRCQDYLVECAQDGEAALACLAERGHEIALVLLDILMPRNDGLETLREIRQRYHDIPIVILSGVSPPRVVDAVQAGAAGSLAAAPPALCGSALEKVRETTRKLETDSILQALHSTQWNRKQAAVLLGMDYKALLYKMKKLAVRDQAGAGWPPVQEPAERPTAAILERAGLYRKQAETEAILLALSSTRWNRKRAAAMLNVEYKALLYKMKKLEINDPKEQQRAG